MSKYIFLGKYADEKTSKKHQIGDYIADMDSRFKADEIRVDDDILELIVMNMKHIEFPLLSKVVEDFYGDFVIETDKLKDLKQEIKKFVVTFKKKVREKLFFVKYKTTEDYPKLLSFLRRLEKLCDEGIKKRLILWGDAD